METKCITDRRDTIIHVLETELHAKAGFSGAPDFTCTIGGMSLLRDGRIVSGIIPDETASTIFQRLAYLGLCEWPEQPLIAEHGGQPLTAEHDGPPLTTKHAGQSLTAEHNEQPLTVGHDGQPLTAEHGGQPEHAVVSVSQNTPDISDQNGLPAPENEPGFCYSIDDRDGYVLRNLFSIISARQRLLNQALAARNAFTVSPLLMDRLLAHPPETVPEVLHILYDNAEEYAGIRIDRFPDHPEECVGVCTDQSPVHPEEYAGIRIDRSPARQPSEGEQDSGASVDAPGEFRAPMRVKAGCSSLCTVTLTGFERCPREERHIHKQLADRIMAAARSLCRVKPYTRNVRNRKYAFHTWLYSIGMAGPEYEEARSVLLGRLYGNTGHRKLDR